MDHVESTPAPSSLTTSLAQFVADTTYEKLDPIVVAKVKELVVDHLGVACSAARNAESSATFLQAVRALGGEGAGGTSTAYMTGSDFSMQHAALLNGAFCHSLEFDDHHAYGVVHAGASVIPAALALCESLNSDGKTFVTAVAVGYEVADRIGRALTVHAYLRGFHSTGTVGVFGAVAALCNAKRLPGARVETAFGIAGSKAAGLMSFQENGAWTKRLHPGFAAHDAFLCVALAEAGVLGPTKVLEGSNGFFHAYSEKTDPEALLQGLGKEWEMLATAVKLYPACRSTHAAIELAADLRTDATRDEVDSITVTLSPVCHHIVGKPVPNKLRPANIVDAQFSIYFQTAIVWLDGSETGWSAYSRIHDQDVQDLCARITCVAAELGTKDMEGLGCRMKVRLRDGSEKEKFLLVPSGEEGNPISFGQVRNKFCGLMRPLMKEENLLRILDIVADVEKHGLRDLTALLS